MVRVSRLSLVAYWLVFSCTSEPLDQAGGPNEGVGGGGGGGGGAAGGGPAGTPVEADEQRQGDPERGYEALVNEGYVSCGIPKSLADFVFGGAEGETISGRNELNEGLPYSFNAFTTQSGVEVVSSNCLTCHASHLMGELVIGLGNVESDFTTDQSQGLRTALLLLSDPDERAEAEKWIERLEAVGPYAITRTRGTNPADNIAAALFAHRDPETLNWLSEPSLEPPSTPSVPVDVPPWWRMKKKNAMFYSAAGRGDHARIMMTASTLCTDTVEQAKQIDNYFPDVAAYIAGISPPVFPGAIDEALAAQGRTVFEATCSRCHGTYGDGGVYPNLLVASADVGTDNTLALGAAQFADVYVEWFNGSFYGEIAQLDPQEGYVAPPLDGIWATAPFLHNGSVPTIEALLDSGSRPTYWTRSFDSNDYDLEALGWKFTELDSGQDEESSASERKLIYDTTQFGYGNGGHVFGDSLTSAERASVIEYLKTL